MSERTEEFIATGGCKGLGITAFLSLLSKCEQRHALRRVAYAGSAGNRMANQL
ncbi:hypothetical protein [Asticcacaulis sp. AC466]|uniref:hypothetical protein n=1 Tax=Asticcacaulis sp. AC466 TaxID=1282362 RepID=UPI00040EDA3B|nr:hypothetical protein [Asticcacaulis sp. AC466]